MKQNYFMGLIACAALTMTGCSNDEINAPQQSQGNNAIEFSTYLGRNAQGSRGTETNDASIKSENAGFGVLAYYTKQDDFNITNHTPNFMWNQQVTYKGTNWVYTPVKYWPTKVDDKVSFFAYAPYVAGGNANGIVLSVNSATGAPTATITLPDNPSQTIDFVAAVQMNKTHDNGKNANNDVKFTLKHEMTRVDIKAKLDEEVYAGTGNKVKTFVVIKDVKINDASTDGEFYNSGVYTFPTVNDSRGIWAPTPNASTYTLNLNGVLNKTKIIANGANGATTSGDYQTGVDGIKLTNDTAERLFKTNEYVFLIPVTNGLASGKATATIAYDIVTEDDKLAAGYSCSSATKEVNLPAGTLKQGEAYIYTFTIKLNEVKLTATVDPWKETDYNTDINYNDTDK